MDGERDTSKNNIQYIESVIRRYKKAKQQRKSILYMSFASSEKSSFCGVVSGIVGPARAILRLYTT